MILRCCIPRTTINPLLDVRLMARPRYTRSYPVDLKARSSGILQSSPSLMSDNSIGGGDKDRVEEDNDGDDDDNDDG